MPDDDLDILANIVRLREAMRETGDTPEGCLRLGKLFEELGELQTAASWFVRGSKAVQLRFKPGQDYVHGPDGMMRPFTLALWAVEAAPDYLPARQQLAEACRHDGADLEWALNYAAQKREAKALEAAVEADDARGRARTRLAEFWLSKGDPATAVDWYLRAAKHAEAKDQLDAAFEALQRASELKAYRQVQRELLRVASLLKKVRR